MITYHYQPVDLPAETALFCTRHISKASRSYKNVLFLIAGGSSLSVLNNFSESMYRELGKDWSFLYVGVTDERLSAEPSVNNFLQLLTSKFGQEGQKRGAHFISTIPAPDESVISFAERYEKRLIDLIKKDDSKTYSIAVFGAGSDGHTAGIMPFAENPALFRNMFNNPARKVIGYDASGKNEHKLRMTIALPFISNLNQRILYLQGQGKEKLVHKLRSNEHLSLSALPVSIFSKVDTDLFTDQS